MKILLGEFCVWLHREGTRNESLHETDNDNGVWEVNFFPNPKPNWSTHSWTTADGKTHRYITF